MDREEMGAYRAQIELSDTLDLLYQVDSHLQGTLPPAEYAILLMYIKRKRKALSRNSSNKGRVANPLIRHLRRNDHVGNKQQIDAALYDLFVYGNAYIKLGGK
jgi:hypothetical protein